MESVAKQETIDTQGTFDKLLRMIVENFPNLLDWRAQVSFMIDQIRLHGAIEYTTQGLIYSVRPQDPSALLAMAQDKFDMHVKWSELRAQYNARVRQLMEDTPADKLPPSLLPELAYVDTYIPKDGAPPDTAAAVCDRLNAKALEYQSIDPSGDRLDRWRVYGVHDRIMEHFQAIVRAQLGLR